MSEDEFGQALEHRCGEAIRHAGQVASAAEAACEEEHRALLEQLRMRVDRCTDRKAIGTITNTTDQALTDVSVTVLLFAPDGTQLTSSYVLVGELAPGETRRWVAPRSPDSLPEDLAYHVGTCEPLAGGGS
jgi:hypothetical protein